MEEILRAWNPRGRDKRTRPATEKEYEEGLVDELRKRLKEGHKVTPQSGRGLRKGDIVVSGRALRRGGYFEDVIELKKGLNYQTYNNLTSQIDDYRRWSKGYVIVVICGDDVDQTYLSQLKSKYVLGRDPVYIFHKRAAKGVKSVSRVI
jgi:hypothetical protein